MAENDTSPPPSPPLPKRGQYNIDFDSIDENTNPFQSSKTLSSSPPIKSNPLVDYENIDENINPFKSSSKLSNFPPGADPFQTRANLGSSPPAGGGDSEDLSKSDVSVSSPSESPLVTMAGSPKEGFVPEDAFGTPASTEAVGEVLGEKTGEKTVTPKKKKKIVKKSKIQSKFKPPKMANTPKNDSDDIQIFMPGVDAVPQPDPEPAESPYLGTPDPPLPPPPAPLSSEGQTDKLTEGEGQPQVGGEEEELPPPPPPCDSAAEAMASSAESDQQFLDKADDGAEEFRETNEALAEASDMDLMDKVGEENEGKAPIKPWENASLLSNFDPLVEEEKSSRKAQSSSEHDSVGRKKDVDLLTNTPPPSDSNKHPATRALDALQAEGTKKSGEPKSESSSEETQFFDALDFPASVEPRFGQKSAINMERDTGGEGAEGKGTMVQLVQVLRYSQTDWNKLKQELELGFQTSLLNKERDWSMLLAERDKKLSSLEDTNKKLKQTNEDMRMVVAEFEKTISQLQADKEKNKNTSSKNLQTLEHERDQALEDLASVENAFSDLHRRYEKSKTIIDGFKRNEEQLKNCVEDLQEKLKKSEAKMQMIKAQAEEQLDKANQDIDKLKKSTKQDMVRLEAGMKKADLRISSLEESLQRKEKENQELTAICDELIAKVGS